MSFVAVEIEPGGVCEDGLSMRFKRADGEAPRKVAWVEYESEAGVEGRWRVLRVDVLEGEGSEGREGAEAVRVDDSSDGTVWLVTGGRQGLLLVHEASGARERVGYLLLSLRTAMG